MKQIPPPPSKAMDPVPRPRNHRSAISKVTIRPCDIFPSNLPVPAKQSTRPGECWSVQERVALWYAKLSGWEWKDVVNAVAIIQGINLKIKTPVRKRKQCEWHYNGHFTLDDKIRDLDQLIYHAGPILLRKVATYLKLQGTFPPGIGLGF